MPIDREHEQVIPLRQVPRYVPSRSPGKRVAPSTVWRWVQKQQLETFATPGGRFTSVEAVGRFIDRISTAKGIGVIPVTAPARLEHGTAARRPTTRASRAGDQLRPLLGETGPGRHKPSDVSLRASGRA